MPRRIAVARAAARELWAAWLITLVLTVAVVVAHTMLEIRWPYSRLTWLGGILARAADAEMLGRDPSWRSWSVLAAMPACVWGGVIVGRGGAGGFLHTLARPLGRAELLAVRALVLVVPILGVAAAGAWAERWLGYAAGTPLPVGLAAALLAAVVGTALGAAVSEEPLAMGGAVIAFAAMAAIPVVFWGGLGLETTRIVRGVGWGGSVLVALAAVAFTAVPLVRLWGRRIPVRGTAITGGVVGGLALAAVAQMLVLWLPAAWVAAAPEHGEAVTLLGRAHGEAVVLRGSAQQPDALLHGDEGVHSWSWTSGERRHVLDARLLESGETLVLTGRPGAAGDVLERRLEIVGGGSVRTFPAPGATYAGVAAPDGSSRIAQLIRHDDRKVLRVLELAGDASEGEPIQLPVDRATLVGWLGAPVVVGGVERQRGASAVVAVWPDGRVGTPVETPSRAVLGEPGMAWVEADGEAPGPRRLVIFDLERGHRDAVALPDALPLRTAVIGWLGSDHLALSVPRTDRRGARMAVVSRGGDVVADAPLRFGLGISEIQGPPAGPWVVVRGEWAEAIEPSGRLAWRESIATFGSLRAGDHRLVIHDGFVEALGRDGKPWRHPAPHEGGMN